MADHALLSQRRALAQGPASALAQDETKALVKARDLTVTFQSETGEVHAVNGVDLDLFPGETLCILGESGSGKSVTLRALMRLNPPRRTKITGTLLVDGHDIITASDSEINALRGKKMAMIFQEPMTALDPVFTIGDQIAENVVRHDGLSWSAGRARALELLELVQVPSAKARLSAYPHELSGGMRQRAMIAIALSCRPNLLLADEPTTALDATVQIQILLLLRQLQEELGMGVIFVTHDLGVAGEISDRIAVMYAGRIVETGDTIAVLRNPLHPYTTGLMEATVYAGMRGKRLTTIPGAPPPLNALPPGCSFEPRCAYSQPLCRQAMPEIEDQGEGRTARCHRVSSRI